MGRLIVNRLRLTVVLTCCGLVATAWSAEPQRSARSNALLRRATEKPSAKAPAAPANREAQPTPPVETPSSLQDTPVVDATVQPEIIRERYPNRGVRIERHVVQDVQLNYVNHGPWSWWDERGQLLARGEYKLGKQHGKWTRVHTSDKGTIFALPLYKGFEKPFTSEAAFEEGVLTGIWTVTDVKGRKMSQCLFQQGEQHGLATWWHVNGQVQRTANYTKGQIDGELREFSSRGEQVARDTYVEGFRLDTEVANYPQANRKRSERSVLVPIARQHYNWFEATVSLEQVERQKVYHGPSTWWYPDGQKEMAGNFEHGATSGQYSWWHPNGQERSRGNYIDGKQDGKWTWWHPNGQKEMEGDYDAGQRVGKWAAWGLDGKVRLVEDHPSAEDVPAIATRPGDKQASVQ